MKPFLIAAVLAAALPFQALAQTGVPCLPRDNVLRILNDNYGEVPVNRGLAMNGMMFEVAANPRGSWSAFFTKPDGISCLVLSGEAWQAVEPKAPPEVQQ